MSTTQPLFQHHKHCDEIFADAEAACANGDWVAGATAFADFAGQLETHFKSEEEVLFPAFESATGMVSGPTTLATVLSTFQVIALPNKLPGR